MAGKKTVYNIITDHIIDRLEKGVVPWKMPWDAHLGMPKNIRGNPYRGINVLMLQMVAYEQGYKNHTWLTYTQVQALKGLVKKGERSTPVIFWKVITQKDKDGEDKQMYLLRYYRVFNIAQVEGITPKEIPIKEFSELPSAESIVAAYPNPPTINKGGPVASYNPVEDMVRVPVPWSFDSEANYYATLFHELVHSTGHKSRLSRPGIFDGEMVGKEEYSKEELIAELGAAFLCSEVGILPATIENQSAYIQGWLKALKEDPKMVVNASAAAHKAVEHILNRQDPEVVE